MAAFRALKAKWWVEEERAIRCLEKDLPACLILACASQLNSTRPSG